MVAKLKVDKRQTSAEPPALEELIDLLTQQVDLLSYDPAARSVAQLVRILTRETISLRDQVAQLSADVETLRSANGASINPVWQGNPSEDR